MATDKNGQGFGIAIIALLAIAAIAFAGFIQLSPKATQTTQTSTSQEVVYPSWIKIDNWYTEQIVRIVVTRLDNGKSYEANFAVPAFSGRGANPSIAYVAFPIPVNAAYKATVYTSGGHSVWWDSIYIQINSQSEAPSLVIAKDSYYTQTSGNLSTSTWANVSCDGKS